MSIRVYFLALPFAAFGTASLLLSLRWPASAWKPTAVTLMTTSILLGLLLFTRYGNESSDFYTRHEVTAMRRLYRIAPEGAVLYGEPNIPWRFQSYVGYDYRLLSDVRGFSEIGPDPRSVNRVVNALADGMQDGGAGRGAYFIMSRSGAAWDNLLQGPSRRTERVEAAIRASPRFRRVYANRDSGIYTVAAPTPR
jgi:hypothetical protein